MGVFLRVLGFESVLAAVLFGSAGRMDLPWFWLLLAVHATAMAIGIAKTAPDLMRERCKPGPSGPDRYVRFVAAPFIFAHLAVAGLDVGRYGWSEEMPTAVRLIAFVGYAAGLSLSIWAIVTNRFFSSVVRIQSDRGHHVIDGGPYRCVRHPGYAGLILASMCGGIVLGSWWSLAPLAPLALIFLVRTAFEDRFLRERLEGYDAYALRVRHRLLPGIW